MMLCAHCQSVAFFRLTSACTSPASPPPSPSPNPPPPYLGEAVAELFVRHGVISAILDAFHCVVRAQAIHTYKQPPHEPAPLRFSNLTRFSPASPSCVPFQQSPPGSAARQLEPVLTQLLQCAAHVCYVRRRERWDCTAEGLKNAAGRCAHAITGGPSRKQAVGAAECRRGAYVSSLGPALTIRGLSSSLVLLCRAHLYS